MDNKSKTWPLRLPVPETEKATACRKAGRWLFFFPEKNRTSIRGVFGPSQKDTYKAAGVVQ